MQRQTKLTSKEPKFGKDFQIGCHHINSIYITVNNKNNKIQQISDLIPIIVEDFEFVKNEEENKISKAINHLKNI